MEFLKSMKIFGIIVSILMIIMGLLVFIKPMFAAEVIFWLFEVGILAYGIFSIVTYARSTVKNGWNLVTGIMAVILGILLVMSDTLQTAGTFAFMLAFLAMSAGINQLTAGITIKKTGAEGSGWLIASGVINILLSFFLIFAPITALLGFGFVAGIYLFVGGIALFAEVMSTHTIR
ncbi:MAG: HdeD family acid-resistance protein [Eubacteriaceae bacterium]